MKKKPSGSDDNCDWKIDEYEERICRIFQQLGLDPATKDNRNWQDILDNKSK